MEIKIMQVTPALADEWLNHNPSNRKMREGVAEKYADDMKHGRWTTCPTPISFYKDGALADGQHRLWAISCSGVPCSFPVARGLERDDGLNIDMGLGRTLVDNARISGADANLSNELIAIARAIAQGHIGNSGSPLSSAMRLQMIEEHRDAALWAVANGPRGRGLRNAVSCAAMARAWYWESDEARLKRFSDVFSSGFADGESESAAVALRNYYQTKKALFSSALWVDSFHKTQNAIYYFMRGRKLTIIKSVNEEAYPLKKKRLKKVA